MEALTPHWIAAIPQDPFDGKPIRLVSAEDHYKVYSIYIDAVDDGGKEDHHRSGWRTPYLVGDWIFLVNRNIPYESAATRAEKVAEAKREEEMERQQRRGGFGNQRGNISFGPTENPFARALRQQQQGR